MKIRFTAFISGASGKTGDAVASSWMGRPYVRKRIIPQNPQSDAQTLVRESLARCVTLWRSLAVGVKGWLDTYAVDYRMSGYNIFISKNRVLEQAAGLLKVVPDNPYALAVVDLAFAAGAAGVVTVTWTAGKAPEDYTRVYAIARKPDENVFVAFNYVNEADGTMDLSGLDTGEDYDCYAMYGHQDYVPLGTSSGEQAVAAG